MGSKESKPSCISYEEALKRVSNSELQRIKEAFKKSAGPDGQYISQSAFQEDVLCEGVPRLIANLLYIACGGTSKGIAFKDLFCGLVLLTRGKEDEKIRLLWNLYSNDSGTYIFKSDFSKALNSESNLQISNDNEVRSLTNTSLILSLFSQTDRVNFEQFRDWIIKHKKQIVLSKWLLSENYINLTSELETPTFYQSLAGVTHLEEQDIGDLEKEFWRLKYSASSGQIDLESLGPLISPPIPKAALSGLFYAFDENRDGHIDFKELCCGVSAACRGPNVERSKFCFKVFDVDKDGILNYSEIIQMIDVLIFVAKESANSNNYRTITRNHVLNNLLRFSRKNDKVTKNVNETHQQSIKQKEQNELDVIEFNLSQEDFMMWSVESSLNLVQPFLDVTFEVCHIVFGLRPQCVHMELNIVKGWLSREERRGYMIGQFWYLVSKDWWNSWLQYTQNYTTIPCSFCKNSPNNNSNSRHVTVNVDEAMVCDESFTSNSSESMGDLLGGTDSSSLGSGSSGISCGRQVLRPGPIDNRNLITPSPNREVAALTGEGGHLKKDTPLVQGIDFELVPKSLWNALSRWYEEIIPLPRQVIQPPNSPEVELELYPLNLRILLHQNAAPVTQAITNWGALSGGYGVLTSGGGYTGIPPVSTVLQPPKRYLAYTAAFSRLATVKLIGEFLCKELKLKQDGIRLWHINPGSSSMDDVPVLLEEENMTLKELLIKDNDQILLEIRNKDLTWPEELSSLSLNQSNTSQERRLTRASIHSVHAPGATGLHNLGNTCFMNSALQVLFNTQPLTQYFRRNMHLFELNTANKLGTKGQLATRYGELLKEIWTATTRSVAPIKLRFCVTKHAPQFAGGGQHDSQELLEWLLDALHEDLNRVTEKPYTELKDSNGRPDEVVAAEAWAQHHSRNQSIVIDLFYGQLKSKVSCCFCGRESVRFDPFSLLSLPLPVENYTYFEILVILLDGSVPIKYGVRVNSDSKYSDVKKKLSSLCHINPSLIMLCELSNSQIKCIFADDQNMRTSNTTELYAYQLPEDGDGNRSRTSSLLAVNIEKGLKDIQRNPENQNSHQQPKVILTSGETKPEQIPIKEDATSGSKVGEYMNDLEGPPQKLVCNTINDCMLTIGERRTSKHTAEISTSPDSTFVTGSHRKRISATNLLNNDNYTQSSNTNSSDEASIEKIPLDSNAMTITSTTTTITNLSASEKEIEYQDLQKDEPIISDNFYNYHNAENDDCDNFVNNENYAIENSSIIVDRDNNCPSKSSVICNKNYLSSHNIRDNDVLDSGVDVNGTKCKIDNNDNNNHNSSLISHELNNMKISSYFSSCTTGTLTERHKFVTNLRMVNAGQYLIAVHRKLTRQDTYFLSYHKTRPSLFGLPLLIPCYENGTNKDLYCAVWMQVNRLLSPLPPTPDQSNHAADCDDSLGYDFPFTLRAVTNDGKICALCPWSNFCRGCEIPCNDDLLLQGALIPSSASSSNSSTPKLSCRNSFASNSISSKSSMSSKSKIDLSAINIAIDWDPTALHLRYQSTREKLWTDHESVGVCRRQQTEPVDLNHCLRAFTSEEKLEQWYHCSHCKGKKPATKKLQIWKLPPILIIHLKRFNCVNGKWVKSQKVVNFPFDDFDPTPYLASVPQETILRHKELQDIKMNNNRNLQKEDCKQEIEEFDREIDLEGDKTIIEETSEFSETKIVTNYNNKDTKECWRSNEQSNLNIINKEEIPIEKKRVSIHRNLPNTTLERRKRLISTSLTRTPVIDGHFKDFHHHKLKEGQDSLDLKYKLYAVVSHSGMLNGGHYVSYAANPNNSWYCYNDSSCREIPSRPNIDPSSAYLLFYERKGLDYEPYLPNIQGRTLPNGSLSEVDESENDLKKMCLLS